MVAIVYDSDYPAPFLPQQSAFDYLLPAESGISPLPYHDPAWTALIDAQDGRQLTRGELRDSALAIAGGLRTLGLKRGDTACIWGPNSLELIESILALLAAGVIVTPAFAKFPPEQISYQINDSGATFLFVAPELVPAFEKARPAIKAQFPPERIVLLTKPEIKPAGSPFKVLDEIRGEPLPQAEDFDGTAAMETAFVFYSSGTTGTPKGIMTSHFNITSQLQGGLQGTTPVAPGKDVLMGIVPMTHVYGICWLIMWPITRGVPSVVLSSFDETPMLEAFQKYKVTYGLIVPPILIRLLYSDALPQYDLSHLNTVVCAAAPLSALQSAAFNRLLPGANLIQAYGMTECTAATHVMASAEWEGHSGHCGRLVASFQARIMDAITGVDASPDETGAVTGELWLRGPSVMKGYRNRPKATAAAHERGGWYKTGDVVIRHPDGWWQVVERASELIHYGGKFVRPSELEALLINHPKVVDAGVCGVPGPDEHTQLPRAYLVLAPDARNDPDLPAEIAKGLDAQVEDYKRLRGGVVAINEIPKSPGGKIFRTILRELAKQECAK